MKNLLFPAVMILLTLTANAQQAVCPKDVPTLKTGGKLNSNTLGTGLATPSSVITRNNDLQPAWYSKIDTVSNTGADSLKQTVSSEVNSLYTWCYINGYSGTNTSCTLTLYAYGDMNNIASAVPVYTTTVTSGVKTYKYTFGSGGGGFEYAGFGWFLTGAGTHASAWYAGMKIR